MLTSCEVAQHKHGPLHGEIALVSICFMCVGNRCKEGKPRWVRTLKRVSVRGRAGQDASPLVWSALWASGGLAHLHGDRLGPGLGVTAAEDQGLVWSDFLFFHMIRYVIHMIK